jgi:hypothetical protein
MAVDTPMMGLFLLSVPKTQEVLVPIACGTAVDTPSVTQQLLHCTSLHHHHLVPTNQIKIAPKKNSIITSPFAIC